MRGNLLGSTLFLCAMVFGVGLQSFLESVRRSDLAGAVSALEEIVPAYRPSEPVIELVRIAAVKPAVPTRPGAPATGRRTASMAA